MIGFCRLNKESLLMIGASSAQSVCGMHASILCWSRYSGSFISHNIPWCTQPQHRKCYKYCCPWWENQSILNEKRIKLLCSKFINPTNVVSQQLFSSLVNQIFSISWFIPLSQLPEPKSTLNEFKWKILCPRNKIVFLNLIWL